MPEPGSLVSMGATRFFQGLRTGDQRTLLAGAALAAFGWWRKSAGEKRVLVHRTEVKDGTSLVIRSGSDQTRVDVRRVDETAT